MGIQSNNKKKIIKLASIPLEKKIEKIEKILNEDFNNEFKRLSIFKEFKFLEENN